MNGPFPDVEGIPFRNALIIDNRPDEIAELRTDLRNRGMTVLLAESTTNARELLNHKPELDLVVLDWYLNESDSMESKLLLGELKDYVFAPVIIYTKQSVDGPKKFIRERAMERIVRVMEKADIDGDNIFGEMTRWIADNPEMRIFLKWSFEVEKCLNPVLWTVYGLEAGGLRALLEIMKHEDDTSYLPAEYDLVSLLLKVLSRKLNHNRSFFSSISEDVKELMGGDGEAEIDVEKIKIFHRFERYISPPVSEPIWTGDIMKQSDERYYVVVTPVCDLCHSEKIERVLLLSSIPFSKYREQKGLSKGSSESIIENKKSSVHYLPYVEGCPDGVVCKLDHLVSLDLKKAKDMIEKKSLVRIATIDSPFIEHLIQRMNSYLMRFGVRDLGDEEIRNIEDETRKAPN